MADHLTIKDAFRERQIFVGRLVVTLVVVSVMSVILVYRYFDLQVMQHETYATQSDRNRVHVQSIAPPRGLLFDAKGQLLAENRPSYTLTIAKERGGNLDETLLELQQLLDIEPEEIEKFRRRLAGRRPFEQVPLKFNLTEDDIAVIAVNRYRLSGVEVKAELVRYYPYGDLFAHVIGYVGRINERELQKLDPVNYSATHVIGKTGIERYYEQALHGSVGSENVETNARGRVLRVLDSSSPKPGNDLILHLDTEVQRVAHEALGEERGAVVALDPKTGGVIAFVSTPSFNPNLFVTGISSKDYKALNTSLDLPLFNRATLGQYPPGSTVKPIIGLAGLEYGTVSAETLVRDPGWYRLPNDERFYRDWKREGHGKVVNLHQAIVESCDIYFYDLAYQLTVDRIHSFSSLFGLGSVTGVDLPQERRGLLPSRKWKRRAKGEPWYPGETLNIGIGQGYMLATPLQLAVATAAVANRGELLEPRILKSVSGEIPLPPRKTGFTLKDDTNWDIIHSSMKDVVHGRRGTAQGINRKLAYRMAGKTGTAQVVGIAQGEEYDSEALSKRNRDHALFVAFAPVDDPQIAVAVIVENGESGSGSAAPVARKVIDQYLLHSKGEKG